MDWKMCAIDDLRRYKQIKIGILNTKDKLRMVRSYARDVDLTSCREGKRIDTAIINALVEGQLLEKNILAAEHFVSIVERGLGSLTDEEKRVLEKFYMASTHQSCRTVAEQLGFTTRTLYRIRDRALQKFTLAMYSAENS